MSDISTEQLRVGMRVKLIGGPHTALGWKGAEFTILGFNASRYVFAKCTKLGPNTEADGADYFPDVGEQYHMGWSNKWRRADGGFGARFKNHGGSK